MSVAFLEWVSGADVDIGQIIVPTTTSEYWYLVEVAGTTGGSEPTFSTAVNGSTTDNTVTLRTRRPFTLSIESSGGDYNTLTGAESANQPDLVTALVFDHGGITGAIADGSAVTQVTSGATGTVTHVTSSQVLIHTITGTFNATDQIYETINVNYVIPSSAGHHAMIEFQCGNFQLSDPTSIMGAVIDSTHYRVLTTTAAGHCRGVSRDVSGVGFQLTSATTTLIVAERFFAMRGVNLANTTTGATISFPTFFDPGGRTVYDEFVAHNANVASTNSNLILSRDNANAFLTNFVVYGGTEQLNSLYSLNIALKNGSMYCTTDQVVAYVGVETSFDNVYAGNPPSSTSVVFDGAGGAPTGANNISSDGSAATYFTSSLINRAAADQFVSTTFATADFHLKAGSDCEGAGAAFLIIPFDIDGDVRDLTSPDVGADEYVASGGGGVIIPIIVHHLKNQGVA